VGLLGAQPARAPEGEQRASQLQHVARRLGQVLGQRQPDVVVVGRQPRRPGGAVGGPDLRRGPGGQRQVVGPVARPHGARLARLGEPLGGVLAHRLEQPVARLAGLVVLGLDQRPLGQPQDEARDRARRQAVAAADRFGRREREAAGEDRQPPQQRLLLAGQQGVAPVERRAQRPGPAGLGPA
jgi:hypothetical protein